MVALWDCLGEMTMGTRSKVVSAHTVTKSRPDALRDAVVGPAVARQER